MGELACLFLAGHLSEEVVNGMDTGVRLDLYVNQPLGGFDYRMK